MSGTFLGCRLHILAVLMTTVQFQVAEVLTSFTEEHCNDTTHTHKHTHTHTHTHTGFSSYDKEIKRASVDPDMVSRSLPKFCFSWKHGQVAGWTPHTHTHAHTHTHTHANTRTHTHAHTLTHTHWDTHKHTHTQTHTRTHTHTHRHVWEQGTRDSCLPGVFRRSDWGIRIRCAFQRLQLLRQSLSALRSSPSWTNRTPALHCLHVNMVKTLLLENDSVHILGRDNGLEPLKIIFVALRPW